MAKNEDINRREFLSYCFMGSSLFASMALLSVYVVQFLLPSANKNPTRKIYITTTDKIRPGNSFKFTDLRGGHITVTNTGSEFIALSTKCTHLGCQVHWKKNEKMFYCPCHEGYFNPKGEVVKGPPPAPLSSYKVEVVDQAIYIHVDEVYRASS
ncbi:ubiquinol-cytochrome c reductase iron-sulfur subunit [Nitrospina gracilis]|nr:ubiquinol-cytochrome c reductase iron-sulfur subunit [Nitrospinaceae bacterium]MBN4078024.1 ubiquinol-cytochrome c reductase iron-sulfur subunit [Nitrospina gracilis]